MKGWMWMFMRISGHERKKVCSLLVHEDLIVACDQGRRD